MLPASHSFSALGTMWQIDTKEPLSYNLKEVIAERIEKFDTTYSRFRGDSLVHAIATAPGAYSLPPDAPALFDFYRELYDLTDGAVTPLIGTMLERAGYDATYSFTPQQQHPLPAWDDVLTVTRTQLTTTTPITIDVGAAGKGYLVDIIASILDHYQVLDYVIDASGDMRHSGATKHVVGLEHPTQPGIVIGSVPVENTSLCASATTRRSWGNNLHHVFDPRTMNPVDNIVATWVLAASTMLADGLATALFLCDPATLASKYDFQYVRYHTDGSVDYSTNFKGEVF
jgi:thiamine biosynthesis lipoprotein